MCGVPYFITQLKDLFIFAEATITITDTLENFVFLQLKEHKIETFQQDVATLHYNIFCNAPSDKFPGCWMGRTGPITRFDAPRFILVELYEKCSEWVYWANSQFR
jgi:hypothetical protein